MNKKQIYKSEGIFAHEVARQFALENMNWTTFEKGKIAQSAYSSNADWLFSLQQKILIAIVYYNKVNGKIRTKKQAREILHISPSDEKEMNKLFGRKLAPTWL